MLRGTGPRRRVIVFIFPELSEIRYVLTVDLRSGTKKKANGFWACWDALAAPRPLPSWWDHQATLGTLRDKCCGISNKLTWHFKSVWEIILLPIAKQKGTREVGCQRLSMITSFIKQSTFTIWHFPDFPLLFSILSVFFGDAQVVASCSSSCSSKRTSRPRGAALVAYDAQDTG